jgi:small subunit ribosomal protein S20
LAHSKSALKRWRQNERHRERNKSVRSSSRTAVKNARSAIVDGDADEATAAVRSAIGVLDKASKSNVVHKNAVARHKSRLMRRLNGIGAARTEEPKKGRKTSTKAAGRKTATKASTKAAAKPKAKKTAAKK